MSGPRYITNDELADIIRDKEKIPQKDYLVVDVRDDDYAGGHIKTGFNRPSETFMQAVDDLVKETKDVKTVIFHCGQSQERGPKAARIFHETATMLRTPNEVVPDVAILRGGFKEFQAKFKDDPELVEGWDKEVWEEWDFN